MSAGEKDIATIKKKYESEIQSLEAEMEQMLREKEHLTQLNKNDPATNKISEQRRKRIQELEQSIQVGFVVFFSCREGTLALILMGVRLTLSLLVRNLLKHCLKQFFCSIS